MPIRWGYLKRVLAGAIFGLYMAHLLYYLNPQVDITPGRLATVTLVYGLTCGLLFGTFLWALRSLRVRLIGKPETWQAHGFGFVVFAAFVSSAIYWMHLRVVGVNYLPVGAVRLLSKATNVITVTSFLLFALWVMERNADRRLSRAIFMTGVALIALSSFWLYQRRDRYHVEDRNVVVANIGAVASHRPVILVAVRNLPYDWIVTMTGEGLLPYFERGAARGYFTRVEPFPTTSPKALWASLATGKLPYRHGVTGRFSYRTPLNRRDPFLLLPSGVGFRAWGLIPPVERISAQLPAGDSLPLWTLFERLQLPVSVVAWQAAVPPPPANLAILGPTAQKFSETGDARTRVLRALATDLAVGRTPIRADALLTVMALDGYAEAQKALHIFANDLPPRESMKGAALRAYAQELDGLLAAIARAHPDHLVVAVAPSAVVPPDLPANAYALAMSALSPGDPGEDDGFLLIDGPGAAPRANPKPAVVTDIVPTVLFVAGLPIGRDMDGHALTDGFTDEFLRRSTLSAIQTYEAERVVVRRAAG
jgi:hypothetical protein